MDINFNNGKIFCTKCGAPNQAGYRFCVKCGAKLVTSVPKPQVEDEPDIPKDESAKVEAEPEMPTFSVFEQAAPEAEPVKTEAEPEMPTFSVFEQAAPKEEPVQTAGFAGSGHDAFEAEPKNEYTGFARSGFAGATTPTAAAGAFATAVEAVKNNKQIDVSDAETVMSLLEQGESSALAKGLPAWDIVPPQVVVRRKHRV
jgi:hypothetical protein